MKERKRRSVLQSTRADGDLSGGPTPHAVTSSNEERRAIEERDDCKCKRSARLEDEDSPAEVSSIITSSIVPDKSTRDH